MFWLQYNECKRITLLLYCLSHVMSWLSPPRPCQVWMCLFHSLSSPVKEWFCDHYNQQANLILTPRLHHVNACIYLFWRSFLFNCVLLFWVCFQPILPGSTGAKSVYFEWKWSCMCCDQSTGRLYIYVSIPLQILHDWIV